MIRANALRFDTANFRRKIETIVATTEPGERRKVRSGSPAIERRHGAPAIDRRRGQDRRGASPDTRASFVNVRHDDFSDFSGAHVCERRQSLGASRNGFSPSHGPF